MPRIEVLDYVTGEVMGIFQVASVPRKDEEIVLDSEDGESPDSIPHWYWVMEVRWTKLQPVTPVPCGRIGEGPERHALKPVGGDPILFPMVYVRKQPKGCSHEAKEQGRP